jgi:multidrug efflux pump subunit AcrB
VAIDRQAAGRLGLSVEQVQDDLRALVEGQRAGVVMQDRRVPLVVRGSEPAHVARALCRAAPARRAASGAAVAAGAAGVATGR